MPLSSVVGAQSIVKPGVCTSSTRPASPYDGQVIYMTDVDQTAVWDGTQWTVLAPIAGGRNMIINGGFDVWQRGTSFVNPSTSPYYTVDRWQTYRAAGVTGMTISRQTSALDGFAYSLRAQRSSGNTSVNDMLVATTFETQNVRRYHNKFVTLSFYARCGANYSSASSVLSYAIYTGTGTDGSIAFGLTGQAAIASSNATLTTTFQRFTVTTSAVLPTSKTQLGVNISFVPVGTAGADDWFEITGVQLEAGSVATPFEFEDYGTTLAKCQRYYYQSSGTNGFSSHGLFYAFATNAGTFAPHLAVQMRTTPTSVTFSNLGIFTTGVVVAVSAMTIDANSNPQVPAISISTSGSLVAGTVYRLLNNSSTSGYVALSAEL
jgi:hypothetical protein